MNNQFVAFMVEFIKRFGSKSPKFFNIISGTSAVLAIVLQLLPALLAHIGTPTNPFLHFITSNAMEGALIASAIVGQLTVENVGTANLPMTAPVPPVQPYTAPQDATATK